MHKAAGQLVRDLGRSGALSGTDRFRFVHLAGRVRTELANMRSGETMGATYDVSVQELSARYATAIRGLIEDPYRLPHPIE